MVTGAENIGFRKAPQITVGTPEQFVRKVGGEKTQEVSQGPNYAKYDGGTEPNYAQYDMYRSPVTKGRAGDKFDMMM